MIKWAVELGEYDLAYEYDLVYESRSAIKAQVLADFIAAFTPNMSVIDKSRLDELKVWKLYVDGSSSQEGNGAELLLESSEGQECCYSLCFDFKASNNEAEYKAFIAGLTLAQKLSAQQLYVHSDSQLVVRQVLGEYEAKEEAMIKYLTKVRCLAETFDIFHIRKIPRSQNKRADALSKLVSASFLNSVKLSL